ncbi:MAG: biosynthetic-type acetolactate synthase large subunit [Bacteroidales bacterium]|jgi:acetolactate synthase-1/2/3 large subunit|nr:biosynthetic-type acetolactate synthase large subunit [Bacteroidales bacterium]
MNEYSGSEILLKSLIEEGVETIFGYPGGSIMPVYDALYDYQDKFHHVLVRHEQGAVHAAQGFARASGKTGVVIVTSGPGATNAITGIADAMIDSTPIVVITGQVASAALGSDAFQETDLIGITLPITKWSYQIRRAEDVAWAVARAFYIASNGRPGPVVLDFAKNAQVGKTEFNYKKCNFIRSYNPYPNIDNSLISQAVNMINSAKKPLLIFGQGITLSGAEKELKEFLDKTDIPAASTLMGLSALPSDYKNFKGMLGMHGSIASNIKTNECDLLIAVGLRFSDRITGTVSTYAKQAKVIHIDIDAAEIGKIIPVSLGILGDAKTVLSRLTNSVKESKHTEWLQTFEEPERVEYEKVISPEIFPEKGPINMGEVVRFVADASQGEAIVVNDVGQNQMLSARYSKFAKPRSLITSGGLGTMGFGLPAAVGAKIAQPTRQVCLFVGDGGLQMTMQELGTIMQEKIGVKIIVLNNTWLGNVRQWQELFFNERYSQTRLQNPDFQQVAEAYGFGHQRVIERKDLGEAIEKMLADPDQPYLLEVCVVEAGMVMPMIPPGKGITDIMLNEHEWYSKS